MEYGAATVRELEAQIKILTNLIQSFIDNQVTVQGQYMDKNDLCKIMGWTDAQFRYRIPILKQFGLIKEQKLFRMSYIGFNNYVNYCSSLIK